MSTPWDDKPREHCGVFGVFDAATPAAPLVARGLHALQHRGQEAAGMVSCDIDDASLFDDAPSFFEARSRGLVRDVFTDSVIDTLKGNSAIGHNRYSTSGDKGGAALRNIQPFLAEFSPGKCAIAHNGNLTNADALREDLVTKGSIFQSSSDTECIIHLMAHSNHKGLPERLQDALRVVEGAFSILALTESAMIGVRDPMGVRPLVLGRVGEAWVLASETCALEMIGAKWERDIEPGEMVVITRDAPPRFLRPFADTPSRFCIFEYVYFSRPDARFAGRSVYEVRKHIGEELARDDAQQLEIDMVCPVPDSGTPAALGYSSAAGIPFELGIFRSPYTGRTFIEPTDNMRQLGVKLKLSANRGIVEGKRVLLVDDSIVRGTTSKAIVQMVRDAGASEVHLRIASPPTRWPCFYGVDTKERSKLIAAQMSEDEICAFVKADSLKYVSIEGLYRACGSDGPEAMPPRYCDACFSGNYPVQPVDAIARGEITLE